MDTTTKLLKRIIEMLDEISDNERKLNKILAFIEDEIINVDDIENEKLMEKYKDSIEQLVEGVESGLICFFNPDTLEIEEVSSDTMFDDYEEYEEQQDDMLDEYELEYMKWNRYIKLEPFNNEQKYDLIEKFIYTLKDEVFASQIENALTKQKPLSDIEEIIESSKYYDDWQNLKHNSIENDIKNQIFEIITSDYSD